MSADKEMICLEYWAVYMWRRAAASDGCNETEDYQWNQWQLVRMWMWGFQAAAGSMSEIEVADFLSEIAVIRGRMQ